MLAATIPGKDGCGVALAVTGAAPLLRASSICLISSGRMRWTYSSALRWPM
jgi:hypothetical protein